jgi:hypothetical protein
MSMNYISHSLKNFISFVPGKVVSRDAVPASEFESRCYREGDQLSFAPGIVVTMPANQSVCFCTGALCNGATKMGTTFVLLAAMAMMIVQLAAL